ncbi:hypothetical protein [Cobetia sp. L2A1]|uniref:hypothetical protein n=1 Tax=Cobetia sp. L2A1 TaxID=2686360 RepID=UPI00131E86ED|nr:hypothetical protein [Cobetia sp. L2A1]
MSTALQDSIVILGAIKGLMESDLKLIRRYKQDEELKFSISIKMIIDIYSIMNKWKRFNTYARDDLRVRETMKIVKPAIDRIKKWRGIEGMRNTMLAHGFRDDNKNGKITCLKKRYFDAEVPKSYAEIMLLSEYCVYICATVICRHKNTDHAVELEKEYDCKENLAEITTMKELEDYVNELRQYMFSIDPELEHCFEGK